MCDGDKLCDHITVLNPPQNPYCYFTAFASENIDIEEALKILSELGMDLTSNIIDNIMHYEPPINFENKSEPPEYRFNAKIFVHQFFISLCNRVKNTTRKNNTDALNYYVDAHLKMTANQASIVFSYAHENGNWLFTGDADEMVFERLISSNPKKDISAKYLKVPHHGSRENLSRLTLKTIAPEVAIISHGNRKFGISRDTHPHHEIIDLLDEHGIRSYYTNDVIKAGKVIKLKANPSEEGGLINFK